MLAQLRLFFSDFSKRDAAILFGVFVMAAAIPIGVFLLLQRNVPKEAGQGPAVLSVVPVAVTKAVGETFDVQVVLNTGDRDVWTVQAALKFDQDVLEPQSGQVELAPVFPGQQVQLNRIDAGAGKIEFALGADPTTKTAFRGTKPMATIRFKVKQSSKSQASITFDPVEKNKVYEASSGDSGTIADILGQVGQPAVVTIDSQQARGNEPTVTRAPSTGGSGATNPTTTVTQIGRAHV